jgi:hypothetical protein
MRAFVVALWLLMPLGCSGCRTEDPRAPSEDLDGGGGLDGGADEVLTEYRFPGDGPRGLAAGADCSRGGPAACASTTCLKVQPGYGQGYVCSLDCQHDGECPADWRCRALFPGAAARVCFPGSGAAPP